jgi:hypothetical protein
MKLLPENPLVTDITIVLIIKMAFLYLIWIAFFSAPLDTRLTHEAVADVFFGQVTHPDSAPPSPEGASQEQH